MRLFLKMVLSQIGLYLIIVNCALICMLLTFCIISSNEFSIVRFHCFSFDYCLITVQYSDPGNASHKHQSSTSLQTLYITRLTYSVLV
jgi:hypothetical protein